MLSWFKYIALSHSLETVLTFLKKFWCGSIFDHKRAVFVHAKQILDVLLYKYHQMFIFVPATELNIGDYKTNKLQLLAS